MPRNKKASKTSRKKYNRKERTSSARLKRKANALTKGEEKMKTVTAAEIAVAEAKKNELLKFLRLLDKVKTLDELEKLKADLENKVK